MASVIGVVIALLVLFVLLVIVLLYAYKKQKLCFKGKDQLFNTKAALPVIESFEGRKPVIFVENIC